MKRGHAMKHEDIRWNQETLVWVCAKCGRTSGRIKKADALAQLVEYKCELPTGESRRTPVDT
jgi:lysyl-tRNA synthetase class I